MLQCISTQFIHQWLLSLWRICAMSHRRGSIPCWSSAGWSPSWIWRQVSSFGLVPGFDLGWNQWKPLARAPTSAGKRVWVCVCDGHRVEGVGGSNSHDVSNPLMWLFLKEKKDAKSPTRCSPQTFQGEGPRGCMCAPEGCQSWVRMQKWHVCLCIRELFLWLDTWGSVILHSFHATVACGPFDYDGNHFKILFSL